MINIEEFLKRWEKSEVQGKYYFNCGEDNLNCRDCPFNNSGFRCLDTESCNAETVIKMTSKLYKL